MTLKVCLWSNFFILHYLTHKNCTISESVVHAYARFFLEETVEVSCQQKKTVGVSRSEHKLKGGREKISFVGNQGWVGDGGTRSYREPKAEQRKKEKRILPNNNQTFYLFISACVILKACSPFH